MVSPLISTAELGSALAGAEPPTLLDVRWTLAGASLDEYRHGHLPGAQFVDLDRELAAPPGPGRHPLPAAEEFAAAMRSHGVSRGRPVVVYDAGSGVAAARAWWLLRYFGHPDVRLLDGGYAAWTADGRPIETDTPAAPGGDFTAEAGHMALLDAAGAAAIARDGILLDARAGERFRGEVEPVDPVAGHIPGARSAPTTENVGGDARFLPAADLRSRFEAAGVRPGVPVGAYCGSGVTAAHEVLALAVAGFDAALYVGSWSDWITEPGRPVEAGG